MEYEPQDNRVSWTPPPRERGATSTMIATATRTPESATMSTPEERIGNLERLVDELKMRNALLEQRNAAQQIPLWSTEKFNCVPRFEAGIPNLSAVQWVYKIEQMAATNGWNQSTMIAHMQSRLTGLAKKWYDNLPNYNYNWEEWKKKLLQTFPDHRDFATVLKNMLMRKKEEYETWSQYYFDKMELIRACELPEKHAVSCIIDGITNEIIQTGARAGRYENPEALFSLFLSTLTNRNEVVHKRRGDQQYQVTSKNLRAKEEKRLHPYRRTENKIKKCFNCQENGHFANKCPKPRKECTICKRLGHTSTKCDRNAEKSTKCDKNTDKVSCKSVASDKCYYSPCEINGQQFLGYVDTGCGGVIIRKDVADSLSLILESSDLVVQGYNNSVTKILGTVNISLRVDLAEAEVTALVVENNVQTVPVLIGQEFIKKNKILVVRKNDVRILEDEKDALPGLDAIPARKITMAATTDVEIPPNHLGYVPVTNTQYEGEIYVEGQVRRLPLREHLIVRCVTQARGGYVGICNVSDVPIVYRKGQVVARGEICKQEVVTENELRSMQVLTVESKNNTFFKIDDIDPLVPGTLSEKYKLQLAKLLNEYRDCFATTTNELGKCNKTEMTINLHDDKPVTYRPYRLSYSERQKVREIVDDLLANNIIRESNSPYASPILLVKKKTGDTRLCVDYRSLNAKTIKDKHPLPRIDEHLDRLKGCQYFTCLDLASGYYQIAMAQDSINKTGFVTPDGHYEYLRMPFGLVNAPAVFQRMINQVLGPLRFSIAMAFMDDILIPSKTIDDNFNALKQILDVFRQAKLTLKLSKYSFFQTQIEYLGHEISAQGVRPGTRKTIAIEKFPQPTNVREVRQFLGLTSYFRKYIENFATIALPLTRLTKKDATFLWKSEQEMAFNTLKIKLISKPILAIYNPQADTEVHTDASKLGVGGILLQKQEDDSLKPVMYFSRQTSKEEQRYHSFELETLAVVSSLIHFRIYLIGLHFKVVTDCNALRTALTKRDLIPRIGRWWLQITEFDFTIQYRPGACMPHADALSRNPVLPDNIQNLDDIPVLTANIIEDDWILSVQLNDSRCKYLCEVLNRVPTDTEEREIHKQYELRQSRIYRKTDCGPRWVVPKLARCQILHYYHDELGHFGLDKTLEAISKVYWFSGMRRYVKKYIANCLNCMYNKKPTGNKPGLLHPIKKISVPFDTIHIDHLGPFVQSTKKNSYLLVITEAFTKCIFLKAVQSTKVGPVINFLTSIIEMYGVPRRTISDRGSCFICKKFKDFCQNLGIKSVLNATATPRANGQVERVNRTILSSLTASLGKYEDKWDQNVNKVQFAYNSTVNKTTGKSPYLLLLSYVPRNKYDSFIRNELDADIHAAGASEELQKIRDEANIRIIEEQSKAKKRFDAKRKKAPQYKEGQLVLVLKNAGKNDGKSRKLLPKYDGPFIVKKALRYDRYCIEDIPGAKRAHKFYRGVCAVDKMKPYHVETLESDDDDDDGHDEDDSDA